jgi:DinB superfamily
MQGTPADTLPDDVQQVIAQLDAADRKADEIVADLTDEQFDWQPDGGTRWSVAQCLEHLAVSGEVYGRGMRDAIDRARASGSIRRAPLNPGFFGRKFADSLEPPARRRSRAPKGIRPSSGLTRAEILRRYHDAHEALKTMARDASAIDANRATFQNPFIRIVRVSVSSGFTIINAHDRRHLWQAEQVIARADFPR